MYKSNMIHFRENEQQWGTKMWVRMAGVGVHDIVDTAIQDNQFRFFSFPPSCTCPGDPFYALNH